MQKNFRVGKNNELIHEGRVYDLHNQYDFGGLFMDGRGMLRLLFKANAEHGAGLPSIGVEFHDVDYLELSESFASAVVPDLDEVGYKNPGDWDDNWLLSEKQAGAASHLFFRFSGDHYLRVHSGSARLRECVAGHRGSP